MIKKLQQKFILITMLSLFIVLICVLGSINGIYIYQTNEKSVELLNILIKNNGSFPQKPNQEKSKDELKEIPKPPKILKPMWGYHMSEETPFQTRYFCVWLNQQTIEKADVSHIASITESEANEYAKKAIETQKATGFIGQYHFKIEKNQDRLLCVFLDCSNDIQTIQNFALLSFCVGLTCALLVFTLIFLLSKRAIRPIALSMEKQKQFITDAGHEFKTPLSIISANTEVIEMCQGENEWTQSIQNQVIRLNELVQNLLTLSKLDEDNTQLYLEEILISEILSDLLDSFSVLINTKQLHIEKQLDSQLIIIGDKKSITQLFSILIDNAIKYSNESGILKLSLKKVDKAMLFSIYNTCDSLPAGDLNCMFDRFYRTDKSRARESGGYGIGLSVAEAITKSHKGKISVKRQENGVCFQVYIPITNSC